MDRRRVRRALACVAVGLLLVAGCGDDDDGGEETAAESSASSTDRTSPSATAPGASPAEGPFTVRFTGTVQGVAVDATGESSRVECVPEDSQPVIHLLDITWEGVGAEQLEHMSIRVIETDATASNIFLSMGVLLPFLPDDLRSALPPEVQQRSPAETVLFETPNGAALSSQPELRRVLVNQINVIDDRADAEGRAPSEGVLDGGEWACPA